MDSSFSSKSSIRSFFLTSLKLVSRIIWKMASPASIFKPSRTVLLSVSVNRSYSNTSLDCAPPPPASSTMSSESRSSSSMSASSKSSRPRSSSASSSCSSSSPNMSLDSSCSALKSWPSVFCPSEWSMGLARSIWSSLSRCTLPLSIATRAILSLLFSNAIPVNSLLPNIRPLN